MHALYKKIFPVVIFQFNNNPYLCTWTFSLMSYMSQLDLFYHGIGRGSLRRAEYGGVT